MLILPFMGAWWNVAVGEGILKIAFSPFYYEVGVIGETLTSSLVDYLIIAAKLTVLAGGVLLIIGSFKAREWWGEKLVKWGALKVVWMLIFLIIITVLGAFLTNRFVPSLLGDFVEGSFSMELSLPYLVGTGYVDFLIEEALRVSAPVSLSFTSTFWLAVLTAGLGIGSRIYQSKRIDVLEDSEDVSHSMKNENKEKISESMVEEEKETDMKEISENTEE